MDKKTLKPGTLIAPVPPVMVSCGSMEESNIITIAWSGILNSNPPKTYISVRPERYSHDIIKQSGEFVINLTSSALVRAADFCGIYSGEKYDKFDSCHLTKQSSSIVSCPMIGEAPISVECKVTDIINLGSHNMFMADIVAISADESLFDHKNALHIEQAGLIAFAHGSYYTLGKKVGQIGFTAAKKRKK